MVTKELMMDAEVRGVFKAFDERLKEMREAQKDGIRHLETMNAGLGRHLIESGAFKVKLDGHLKEHESTKGFKTAIVVLLISSVFGFLTSLVILGINIYLRRV